MAGSGDGCLRGQVFALGEFGSKDKIRLTKAIQAAGGSVSYIINKKVQFLVASPEEVERDTSKVSSAVRSLVPVVDESFVSACLSAGALVPGWDYILNRPPELLEAVGADGADSYVHGAMQKARLTLEAVAAFVAVSAAEDASSTVSSLPDVDSSADEADSRGAGSPPLHASTEDEEEKEKAKEEGVEKEPQPWADQVEEEDRRRRAAGAAPLWQERLAARQAEVRARREREQAERSAAEAARRREIHQSRLAAQREERAEALDGRQREKERAAALALERKANKKKEVFAKKKAMEEERRAQREAEAQHKKATEAERRQKVIEEKLAELTAIARKIVERELHKDEYEAKQRAFLAEKAARLEKKKAENRRKLFVGGVLLDDIRHVCTKLTGEREQEKYDSLVAGRTEALLAVFRSFGEVEAVLPFWEAKHAFVLYRKEKDAAAALAELSVYENRKKHAEETRKALQKVKKPPLMAHKPNYYVRWNYNKSGGKKKKTGWKTNEKKDEQEADKQKEKRDNDNEAEAAQEPADGAAPVEGGEGQEEEKEGDEANTVEEGKAAEPVQELEQREDEAPAQEEDEESAVGALGHIARAPDTRLVWTSSLVIMPPQDLWGPFVEIKKHHMNPRIKRPPFPHITLLAPFVQYSAFPRAKALLRNYLESIEPFTLAFNEFKLFANAGSNTLYLDPVVTPASALQATYKVVSTVYAQCVEANASAREGGEEGGGFAPHIGVGYFKSKKEAQGLQAKYQQGWKPLVFRCQELYCLSRVGDGPFLVREVIPLGKRPARPLFACVPE